MVQVQTMPTPLDQSELEEVLIKSKNGDKEAFDKAINHNVRLVYHIAAKFGKDRHLIEEYASIGIFGLIKAVKNWSEERKTKFAAFASVCIYNEIKMFLRKEKRQLSTISLDAYISIEDDNSNICLYEAIPSNHNFILEERLSSDDTQTKFSIIDKFLNSHKNEKDKKILLLYLKGVKQKEISLEVGICQSYVSRKLTSIQNTLIKMKKRNEKYGK